MKVLQNVAPRLIAYRPPRIAFTLIAIATALQFTFGDAWHSSAPLAGSVAFVTGLVLMMRAWWLFKINDTAICPTSITTTFLTGDVYAVTRNPMYLGMILMLAGIALMTGSLWLLFVTAVDAVILDAVFCRYEEQKLLRQYGSRYADYHRNVRRWL